MSTSDSPHRLERGREALQHRFSLRHDMADAEVIDRELRTGIELTGATAWILIFAIVVASVGLNVNSTAVIIGAMLISPLMGPILGIGYGAGIYDFDLVKKAFSNLGVATLISLVTSTGYFALTPLSEAQSELLARTFPTIWDVIIATFGGLAGIVAATRRQKSNVIPGVAIATALMPPLCTAGYGLASLSWKVFLGAFYLFAINCVFIAAGTVAIVWGLKLPRHQFVDASTRRRVTRWLVLLIVLTALPSLYLAYRLVGNEVFRGNARQFVRREFMFNQTHVVQTDIDPTARRIEVTLIGQHLDPAALQQIQAHLQEAGLGGSVLLVHQADDTRVDVTALKAGLLSQLYHDTQLALNERDSRIAQLQHSLDASTAWTSLAPDVERELKAQFPALDQIVVGDGVATEGEGGDASGHVAILLAQSTQPLGDEDRRRIEAWFKVRTKAATVRVEIAAPAPAAPVRSGPHSH